ncbi:MAG: hypothetical protein WAZ48_14075 [Lysobacteraceae bacterium]
MKNSLPAQPRIAASQPGPVPDWRVEKRTGCAFFNTLLEPVQNLCALKISLVTPAKAGMTSKGDVRGEILNRRLDDWNRSSRQPVV